MPIFAAVKSPCLDFPNDIVIFFVLQIFKVVGI